MQSSKVNFEAWIEKHPTDLRALNVLMAIMLLGFFASEKTFLIFGAGVILLLNIVSIYFLLRKSLKITPHFSINIPVEEIGLIISFVAGFLGFMLIATMPQGSLLYYTSILFLGFSILFLAFQD